jgi:triosephosphate isomerase
MQGLHWDKKCADAGDISSGMLVNSGSTHVRIGHSERRHDHGELERH